MYDTEWSNSKIFSKDVKNLYISALDLRLLRPSNFLKTICVDLYIEFQLIRVFLVLNRQAFRRFRPYKTNAQKLVNYWQHF